MLKNDLILRNPLRLLGYAREDILAEGEFGAVLARAGVGKTAFLVQLALNNLLRDKNVLHISLNDPIKKVNLCYEEAFRNISAEYNVLKPEPLWTEIIAKRFIMTFKSESFTVPRLEERLTDLIEQNIFMPQVLLIDGLAFDENVREFLSDLKSFVQRHAINVWFAIRTHRHEAPAPDGLPLQLSQVSDMFAAAIQLQPHGKDIYINVLKGETSVLDKSPLLLDATTMLIKNNKADA